MARQLVDPTAALREYLAASRASSTRRAYASDFADFQSWGERVKERALPATPIAVGRYLAHLAKSGLKVATISRRAVAIRSVHLAAGFPSPTETEGVKAVLRGIRRRLGSAPIRKAPAVAAAIASMLEALPTNLAGLRDRALLLLGFAAALRRSELVALKVNDLERLPEGLRLTIRRSKTDQEGEGYEIPVPRGSKLRPVEALETWLKAAGIKDGPLFREIDRHGNVGRRALSDRSVARIVKRAAAAAKLDPKVFSGHSLRAGFVTSALAAGADPLQVMGITRHAKIDTLKVYDRRERGFRDHAGKRFL
jgi:site-specific recombinase XerD